MSSCQVGGCGGGGCGGGGGGVAAVWALAAVLITGAVVASIVGVGKSRGGRDDPPANTQPAKAEEPVSQPEQPKPADAAKADDKPADVLSFKVKRIDGTEEELAKYKGRVVVIVNVASKCGFTTQYEGLQALYAKHKEDGLVVLGFPANNFGNQEPGENKDIAAFCTGTYGVEFPMFEKISVKGDDAHPLYKALAAQPGPIGGEPKWNFTKFVLDREGKVVARSDAERANVRTKNLEDGLVRKVEELLAAAPKADDAK